MSTGKRQSAKAIEEMAAIVYCARAISPSRIDGVVEVVQLVNSGQGFPLGSRSEAPAFPVGLSDDALIAAIDARREAGDDDVKLTPVEAAAQNEVFRNRTTKTGIRILADIALAAECLERAHRFMQGLEGLFPATPDRRVVCSACRQGGVVASTYCQRCRDLWRNIGRPDPEDFEAWVQGKTDVKPAPTTEVRRPSAERPNLVA